MEKKVAKAPPPLYRKENSRGGGDERLLLLPSTIGGGVRVGPLRPPTKKILLRFLPQGGGGLFHYSIAFLLRFSPCGGLLRIPLMGAFFHHLGAFLLLFFSMWGIIFSYYWGPFLGFPSIRKCLRSAMPPPLRAPMFPALWTPIPLPPSAGVRHTPYPMGTYAYAYYMYLFISIFFLRRRFISTKHIRLVNLKICFKHIIYTMFCVFCIVFFN